MFTNWQIMLYISFNTLFLVLVMYKDHILIKFVRSNCWNPKQCMNMSMSFNKFLGINDCCSSVQPLRNALNFQLLHYYIYVTSLYYVLHWLVWFFQALTHSFTIYSIGSSPSLCHRLVYKTERWELYWAY